MKLLNLIMFAFMIVMNYLANALPLNGKTTGQLSDFYPNLFVPAGITFSIWGIIYLLLAAITLMQFSAGNREIVEKIGWLYAASSLLNGLWIVAWHYQKLGWSFVIMLGMLALLTLINLKLRPVNNLVFKAGFGIYLGWICIATIANVTALLVDVNWNGFGLSEQTWAIALVIIGLVVTSLVIVRVNNPFVGLSVVWAFAGIAIKRQDDYRAIFLTAIVALLLAAVVVVWFFAKRTIAR